MRLLTHCFILLNIALLSLSAISEQAMESLHEADRYYYDHTNFEEAYNRYLPLAQKGNPYAQVQLGLMYLQGHGLLKDEDKAIDWCRKSYTLLREKAEKESNAKYYLAKMYRHGCFVEQNYNKASKLAHPAAYEGDVKSQALIGSFYIYGTGVRQDKERGIEWLEKAADKGFVSVLNDLGNVYYIHKEYNKAFDYYKSAAEKELAIAQYNLGNMYFYGTGTIQKNTQQAYNWHKKAALQNYAAAQSQIGWNYETGKGGTEKNLKKSIEWYTKAAAQGYPVAQNNLGLIYEHGKGVEQNYTIAREWYEKAAAQDYGRSLYVLGYFYYYGHGVEKDDRKAIDYYKKALKHGFSPALLGLGIVYHQSLEFKNYGKAYAYYKKAIKNDLCIAMNNLGVMYGKGEGVDQDFEKAREWYEKATDCGDSVAISNLSMYRMYGL